MDRVVTRAHPADLAAADLRYWLAKPIAERVAAVEVPRQEAFAVSGATPTAEHAEPRLQRVCRVTQRLRG